MRAKHVIKKENWKKFEKSKKRITQNVLQFVKKNEEGDAILQHPSWELII